MRKWLMTLAVLIIALLIVVSIGLLVFQDDYETLQEKQNNSQTQNITDIDCLSDLYNCGDFETRQEAQDAFDKCNDSGFGDVYNLDNDGDGVFCESLD